MTYRPSDVAAQLTKADLDDEMARTHPSMKSWVENSITRRDAVIDLCQGTAGGFEMPNAQGHYATGYDPQQADVLAEALIQNQLHGRAWWARQDPAVVRFFLARIKSIDASHPFVTNWRVWAMDTLDPTRSVCPSWPEML